MDLEHISSLQGKREGNFDHPSNWVYASPQLNRLKKEGDLIGSGTGVKKFSQGKEIIDFDSKRIAKTFRDFTGDDPDEIERISKLLGGNPLTGRKGKFGKTAFNNMNDEEREEMRDILRGEGATEAEITKMIPYKESDYTQQLGSARFLQNPDDERFEDRPAIADPEQYEKEIIVDARDKLMKRNVIQQIKDKYPGIKDDDIKSSEEYKDFLRQMALSTKAKDYDTGAAAEVEDDL